jgi:hypothetical protein
MGTGSFGGVLWQHPVSNFGNSPGLLIPAEASRVSFHAVANMDGSSVAFQAGRIVDPMLMYRDTVDATEIASLTTEMQRFEIDVSNQTYDRVIGGFGWTVTPGMLPPDGYQFCLDNIRWEWDEEPPPPDPDAGAQ